MGALSILPEQFSFIEKAISYLFIFLGVVTIGPWLLVFVYDFLLYVWRAFTHDVPIVGGAARGEQRPRAPSLSQRPNGHRRRFTLAALSVDMKTYSIPEDVDGGIEETKRNDSLVGSPDLASENIKPRRRVLDSEDSQVGIFEAMRSSAPEPGA